MRHKSERTTLRYYAAVSKARCKDVHQKLLNDPSGVPQLKVEKMPNGEIMLVSTDKVPGIPMTITHARILQKDEAVDK